ncbi:F0F1 ATP synthase subunit delta [Paroceanicella profunda]|uniref:ATP synthase subunit delta n=1 Tax=Paroceanicella profunda TaxID=2579971 RepID=A0A5B8G0N6_9RHOB|nr:F0F1 ATP synthase subunit delta [Paroceanicella profunda]QDL91983.1 F0F1 ATP synthase subunit delta [Paroceanicella profunda]
MTVSASATLVSGAAGRYATALFELATEANAVSLIEADLAALQAALDDSSDLRDVIKSPVYSREDQARAMAALAQKMELGVYVTSTVQLMAANRRLFVLPELIAGYHALAAEARGEVSAEVTAAAPLADAQLADLKAALRNSFGKEVAVNVTVDDAIIGGLVVKVGSKMIDTSIRSKLMNLQNAMKEVG